jgi:Holliday junction DNA helicase RuvA
MIGRLTGTLAGRGADAIVVDVGGVGYQVAVSPRHLAELPPVGEEVVVHTHLHVREDQLALFGFPSGDERDLFRVLLGASGVGPKVALAILATLPPPALRRAVLADDTATLTTVPGIGPRTAQRLVIDLRARLDLPDGEVVGGGSVLAEVRGALEGLGYQASEIREALAGLDGAGDAADLLRAALQRLGGGS